MSQGLGPYKRDPREPAGPLLLGRTQQREPLPGDPSAASLLVRWRPAGLDGPVFRVL